MGAPKHFQIARYPYSDVVSLVKNLCPKKGKALEVACGTGNNLVFFAENGYDTYGMDLDTDAIEYAKNFLREKKLKATLDVADMAELPYKSNFFDIVLDRGSIQANRIDVIKKIVAEAARVLKKGGMFVIVNMRTQKDSVAKNYLKEKSFRYYDYIHFTTEKELRGLLKNKFKIEYLELVTRDVSAPKKSTYSSYIVVAKKI